MDSSKSGARTVAIAVVIAILVMQFIKPTIVKQRSMQPNFYTNDYLFISKQSYKLFGGQPERGDVIVFKSKLEDAEGETKMLIKRVIGVPGDVINIHDGKVYINGKEIDDSYTMDHYTTGDITELVVPADHLFCMGDNRAVSIDSRSDSVGACFHTRTLSARSYSGYSHYVSSAQFTIRTRIRGLKWQINKEK